MEIQYRLKKDGKFVGYSREIGTRYFFSKDGFWWNGSEIDYDDKDLFTGVKDRNRNKIFVGDVVEWQSQQNVQRGIVVFGQDQNCVIENNITQEIIPLFFEGEMVAFDNSLVVVGYVNSTEHL
ncbi:hypothetical protein [Candidatus Uabimicrobium amorphum]|uniref:YopX protein domain-containing protein n=1 Tax=Uabimicrobium amorphum TaxID=2596890 RepID=A0A5S9IRH0_UABAM|nr:hypothetical protein [Candidatus Uabimicrobium amorphum]BBM85345.1 hypothetical protein UABAM_03711 [Candidatus Uabimicrobium amorphum]